MRSNTIPHFLKIDKSKKNIEKSLVRDHMKRHFDEELEEAEDELEGKPGKYEVPLLGESYPY